MGMRYIYPWALPNRIVDTCPMTRTSLLTPPSFTIGIHSLASDQHTDLALLNV